MTTVLLTLSGPVGSHPIASDLQDAGISVLGSVQDRSKLVQEVLRSAPDVLICHDPLPGDALFNALQTIAETSPRPVMVFTSDSDAGKIARASEVGVHAYVVNGYSPERLRPLIHVAQARFAREQAMRAELTDLASRFDERKMVDRAKAILMRARQVSDDDAFQMLRTASMHSNQRLGRVSEHIIHSARFAEDVNQSGQLRMLSQRLVVLSLFELAGVQTPLVQSRLQNAIKRVDGNLAGLEKSLSKPTFGDLLGQVAMTWGRLKPALLKSIGARQVLPIDDMAEQLLQDAERLTTALENAGAMPPLQVLNMAGRQRMLSQRFAKYALLAAMAGSGVGAKNDKSGAKACVASMQEARTEFEKALHYLGEIPLTSADIRQLLANAATSWAAMLAGAAKAGNAAQGGVDLTQHLETLAIASEEALTVFEKLSVHYEQSIQMLVG